MLKNTILFFTRNKLKVLFLIFIISIAVLSGIITGGIFKSFADTKQKVRLVDENIMNVKIFSNDVKAFENFLYDLKEKHFEDIKIYKFKAINLSYKYFRSSEGTFQAFVSNKRGVEQFLEEIGLELIEGTIFDNGNLIASKSFLDSHGIRLGDIYKSDSEYFYNEELKISGVLYNSSIIAFIDEDYVDEKETYTSFLIKGNEIQFKAIEKSIRSSEFFNNNIFINTPNSIRNDFYKKYFSYISQNIFMNFLISLIFILGIILFFSYFLRDQYKEISLLHVFGYSKKFIFSKNIFQYSIICFTGWGLGILLSIPFLDTIEKNVFNKVGMFISIDFSIYITSITIPLFIILYIYYKSKKIMTSNIFNLIKKINVKETLKNKRNKFIYFKYLQRSGNFKNLFISNFIFIFLIIFFTSLTYSNYQIQLNNIEYFKGKTFINNENIVDFEENYLDELKKENVIPVKYNKKNFKLPFGTQNIYDISNSSLADIEDSLPGYIVLEKSLGDNFITYDKLKEKLDQENYFIIFIGNIINTIIIFVSILINMFIIIKNTIARKKEIILLKIFGFQNHEVISKIIKEYFFVFINSIILALISSTLFWQLFEIIFIKNDVMIFKIGKIYLNLFIFSVFIVFSYLIPIYLISKSKKPTFYLY